MKRLQRAGVLENRSRRDILLGAAVAATSIAASSVVYAAEHDHAGHMHPKNKNEELVKTAMDCIAKGHACMDHCIELVKGGDTSIANCLDTVSEMLATCTALSQLASYQSSHLPALAKVCISVCKECEAECRKHEDKHAECKACAESCRDCIAACEKIAV